jgi:transposase-like protein
MSDLRRAEGLRLLESGRSPKEVASQLGVGLSTVYRWRELYLAAPDSGGDVLRAAHPRILRKLVALAQEGDIRAIKEVLSRISDGSADPSLAEEHPDEEAFVRIVEHELNRISPLLATQWLAVWFRIMEHLNQVVSGELPLPPPVKQTELPPPDPFSFTQNGNTAADLPTGPVLLGGGTWESDEAKPQEPQKCP